ISVVPKGKAITMEDLTTTRFERYDTVGRVYSLFATLNPNPHLKTFGFLVGWPKLKDEKKRALYSEYACHELNFFLYKKDPEFFRQVVAPYLAHKKDKTFMDRWLIQRDLGRDLSPWEYARLNTVERILLSRRIDGEGPRTARHLRERFELMPPDTDRFLHLYRTALQGRALEASENELADDLDLKQQAGRLFKPGAQAVESLEEMAKNAPAPKAPQVAADKARSRLSVRREALAMEQKEAQERLSKSLKKNKSDYYEKDSQRRSAVRQLYRKLDKTREWVENNYHHLPIEKQLAGLVGVNAFWVDYANHDPAQPFYSEHLAEASNNFTEMMFALAVLDLPFESAEHQFKVDGRKLTLTPGSDLVLFHEEIREAKVPEGKTPILVSQNFFRNGDRYKTVNGQRVDKFVTDEFLIDTVYGCQVVVTNPTSSRQKLDVLLQVPAGAIPVKGGRYTRSVHLNLQPYNTTSVQYFFYFPAPGQFAHYPVHVAKDEQAVAFAEPVTLNVLAEPTKIDRESWQYISQHGQPVDVVAYLNEHNLGNLDLAKIAFRMKDKAFFARITKLLARRHRYDHTLWSYGIHHNDLPTMRQYLKHADGFVRQCGLFIESKPLTIHPVARHLYQHREYAPLVNARTHPLGKRRKIVNDRFHGHYHHLMKVLSYKRDLDDQDLMAVTYTMILQDRIEEALDYFKRVNAEKIQTRLQHDYFAAYLDMFSPEPKLARAIAARYARYPVDRWRQAFEAVTAQLDEIEGKAVRVADQQDRGQVQASLASTAPNVELKVEANTITIDYQNVDRATVNYYLMDVELLFSRNPFVQKHAGQFAYIHPNMTRAVELPKGRSTLNLPLPEDYHAANVLVEVVSAGQRRTAASYANAIRLQMIENYGQAVVRHAKTAKPLPATYFKVYARMKDGKVRFYKDGYSDLRGRIDYTSLNTNELDNVERFSLLIASDRHGTMVREVAPPKR
ncbi:MAG: hypothetical protein R3236_04310, partial [Phycisphaeraceae bacterium]|nr:hypothetical protein [Phycisphaeraceae bacterium]